VDDAESRFTDAIIELDHIAGELTPDEARKEFDDATLQDFWRRWTGIAQWAGGLWRLLSEDLEDPARPVTEPDIDEVGEAG